MANVPPPPPSNQPEGSTEQPSDEEETSKRSTGAAIGSLVCGILALLFSFVSVVLGVLFALVAVTLGIMTLRRHHRHGLAIGGLVTGLLGLLGTFAAAGDAPDSNRDSNGGDDQSEEEFTTETDGPTAEETKAAMPDHFDEHAVEACMTWSDTLDENAPLRQLRRRASEVRDTASRSNAPEVEEASAQVVTGLRDDDQGAFKDGVDALTAACWPPPGEDSSPDEGAPESEGDPAQQRAQAKADSLAVSDTTAFREWDITLRDVQIQGALEETAPRGKYVVLLIGVTNTASMERALLGGAGVSFKFVDVENDRQYSYDSDASLDYHQTFDTDAWHLEDLGPGLTAQFPIVFDVPEDTSWGLAGMVSNDGRSDRFFVELEGQ